jgi:hypothetical protein
MNAQQAQAIAFLLSQHNGMSLNDLPESAEAKQEKVLSVSLTPAPSKKAKQALTRRNAEEKAIELRNKSLPPVIVALPETRQLDPFTGKPSRESASQFIRELHHAGRRQTEHGTWHTDSREVRQDTIRAIAGFCGYQQEQNFGMQDSNARSLANRILSAKVLAPTRSEVIRSAVQGGTIRVTGLPDHYGKRLDNLKAQQREAVDAKCRYDNIVYDESLPMGDRELACGLSDVESERIDDIRRQIGELTY